MTRKYLVLVKLSINSGIAFAGQFWGRIMAGWIGLFLTYYLWLAVYGGNSSLAGVSLNQMITYVIVSSLLLGVMQRGPITYIGNAFDTGELFKDFIKPLSFPAVVFSSFLGQSFVFLMVRGIPVFVFGAVFIGILFPAPGFIILFIFSLLVSFFLYFIMEFILAQFIFFVKGYYGIIAL